MPARGGPRSRWAIAVVAALAAVAAFVGVGDAWLTPTRESAPQPASFWGPITGELSQRFFPETVDEVAKAADAIVLAHVAGITEGRELVPESDPTPPTPPVPRLRTVHVLLAVDRAVSGPVASGTTVKLEMSAPPLPFTTAMLQPLIPSGQLLFFLWNNASIGKRSGVTSPVIEAREREFWVPASSRGVIAEGPDGLYEVLEPEEADMRFLRSFGATTLEGAIARSLKALS